MTFSYFASKLYAVLGQGESVAAFTRTLFSVIASEEIFSRSDFSYRGYYTGRRSIARLARAIFPYVDVEEFEKYLRGYRKQSELYEAFASDFVAVKPTTITLALSEAFHLILYEAVHPTFHFLPMEDRFLTPKQAAAILGISRRTVRGYIAKGVLPYVQIRRAYLVKLSDVKKLQQYRGE